MSRHCFLVIKKSRLKGRCEVSKRRVNVSADCDVELSVQETTSGNARATDKRPSQDKSLSRGNIKVAEIKRCLELQNILRGVDSKTLDSIIKKGSSCNCAKGRILTNQGDVGDKVYFILRGNVSVKVNDRLIGMRTAKECVGEMSALDPTQKRCATLVANEQCALWMLPSVEFLNIIDKCPIVVKNIAIELSERLRERAKFIRVPNLKPRMFIGSSKEGLSSAKKLKNILNGADVHVWDEDVFHPSKSALEALIDEAKKCDFALLLLTADDKVISRGRKGDSPRDNMLFELGLFMGEIGRDRTYLVTPDVDIKLPSDLDGITRKIIHRNVAGRSQLKEIAESINEDIQQKGSR